MSHQDNAQTFEFVGGPADGTITVISRCEHNNWPDLVHPDGGHYHYDVDSGTYVWKAEAL